MDIKQNKPAAPAGPINKIDASAGVLESLLSQMTIRTMKQDLEKIAGHPQTIKPEPDAAKETRLTPPPESSISDAAAAKREEIVTKQKHLKEFEQLYGEAMVMIEKKLYREAIDRLRQIIDDKEISWWMKWKADGPLKKAQKALQEQTAPPLPKPPAAPLPAENKPAIKPEIVSRPPIIKAVPPVGLPTVEEKIIAETKTPLPAPPPPPPTPLPQASPPPPPKPKLPIIKTQEPKLKKPIGRTLAWLLVILIIAGLAAGGWFYWQTLMPEPSATPSIEPTPSTTSPTPTPPAALFEMESTEIIETAAEPDYISNLTKEKFNQLASTTKSAGNFTQILFRINGDKVKFASFTNTAEILGLDLFFMAAECYQQQCVFSPPPLKDYLNDNLASFFVYSQTVGTSPSSEVEGRAGLVVGINNAKAVASTTGIMQSWEEYLPEALQTLFFDKQITKLPDTGFRDNGYKNIAIRYMNFPDSGLSFDWTIIDEKLLITTSKESMYAAIDRLLAAAGDG